MMIPSQTFGSQTFGGASQPAAPEAAEIRAYLAALLAQKEFNTSDRNRRFLSYIIEETLEGRAERIKAYNIALAALDRSDDFDPLTDPIVRIEASRLRRALEHYYLTVGKSDSIRIGIPKGSYVPTFEFGVDPSSSTASPEPASTTAADPEAAELSLAHRWRIPSFGIAALCLVIGLAAGFGGYAAWQQLHGIQTPEQAATTLPIAVLPFENTGNPDRAFVAQAFTYELMQRLARSSDVTVFSRAAGLVEAKADSQGSGSTYRYALYGSVQMNTGRLHVTAIMAEPLTNRVLQAWTFDRAVGGEVSPDTLSEVADQLVLAVREVSGAGAAPRSADP